MKKITFLLTVFIAIIAMNLRAQRTEITGYAYDFNTTDGWFTTGGGDWFFNVVEHSGYDMPIIHMGWTTTNWWGTQHIFSFGETIIDFELVDSMKIIIKHDHESMYLAVSLDRRVPSPSSNQENQIWHEMHIPNTGGEFIEIAWKLDQLVNNITIGDLKFDVIRQNSPENGLTYNIGEYIDDFLANTIFIFLDCMNVDETFLAYPREALLGGFGFGDKWDIPAPKLLSSGVAPVSDAVENIMYPNPVKNELFINLPYTRGEIISMTGSVVKVLDPMLNTTDIRELHKGLYILKLESNGKVYNQKFVKTD
jgi:hypothetical protein